MKILLTILFLFSCGLHGFSNLIRQKDSLFLELKISKRNNKAELYYEIADVYSELNSFVESKRFINKSIKLAVRSRLNNIHIKNLNLLAELYRREEKLDLALNTILEAFNINIQNDLKIETRRNVILTRVLSDMKANYLALKYLKINRNLWRNQPDNYQNFLVLSDLGVGYLKLNNLPKALAAFKEGLVYKQKDWKEGKGLKTGNGDLSNVHVYNNLGVLYYKMQKLDSAMHYYKLALEQVKSIKAKDRWDRILYSYVNGNIGMVLAKKKNFGAAFPYLMIDYKMLKKYGTPAEIVHISLGIAEEYHMPMKNWQAALQLINNSLQISRDNNIQNNQLKALKLLSDLYQKKNDFKKSLIYYQKYVVCRDNIDLKKEIVINKAFNSLAQYKIKEKVKEIEFQKLKNKSINNRYLFTFSLLIIFIILILIIIRKKISDQKKMLEINSIKNDLLEKEAISKEKELDYKNRELKQLAMHIIEKNNYMEMLKKSLKPTQSESNAEAKLKQAYISINQKLKSNSDTKNFEMHLDEVHHSFLLKLGLKFPDLSEGEKRLCSLLVLNFSSKEIADIFNISVAGINKSRQRLRKKLNVDPQTDLCNYLTDSFL